MERESKTPESPKPPGALGGPGVVHFFDKGPHLARVEFFPVGAGWIAFADIGVEDGRMLVASLQIYRGDQEKGIDSSDMTPLDGTVLRRVKTSQILNRAYRELVEQPGQVERWESFLGEPVPRSRHAAEKRASAAVEAGVTTGPRRGFPDSHYRKVACLYLDLWAAGWSRGILPEIARRMDITPERARDYVHGATTREFLSPGKQGVAGGRLPGPALVDYKPRRRAGPPTTKTTKGGRE